MIKFGFKIKTRSGTVVDNLTFAARDRADAERKVEQIYQRWLGPKGKFPLATNARPRLPEDAYGPGKLMIWPD